MPVTDLLERNHKLYGNEIALVELNPSIKSKQKTSWREYSLVQATSSEPYRREITWSVFDEKANRVANMLLERGIKTVSYTHLDVYKRQAEAPRYQEMSG